MNSGFLLINKPSGPTSHDMIDELRKISEVKKIGHAGTLDPFASGLLIVGVGREATRRLGEFLKLDKEYIAILKLGYTSDTYDRNGKIKTTPNDTAELTTEQARPKLQNQPSREALAGTANPNYQLLISKKEIQKALQSFSGEQLQIPPMYSAKKIKGKKLYELARKGINIKRKPAEVTIYELRTMDYAYPFLKLFCKASSGTYMRSLAHDIGQKLGIGAYLEVLQRTAISKYKLKDAVNLSVLTSKNWTTYLTNL